MYRSNMWALKNKTTNQFKTYNKHYCVEGPVDPVLFRCRDLARAAKDQDYKVVKVSVTVREAA